MKIRTIVAALLIIVFAVLAMVPMTSVRSDEGASWMAKVPDETRITEMSIPGSHDSGATHSIGDVAGKCQDLSIADQLKAGVRFLDIRLRLFGDSLRVVHSMVDQSLSFESVMDDINAFLKENDSETVIISIKEDYDPTDSTLTFERAVDDKLSDYEMVDKGKLPSTLGEARGKAYILARYTTVTGIAAYSGWADSTTFDLGGMHIQDHYCLDSVDEKIDDIKAAFEYSDDHPDKLTLNFTSGYLDGAFPPSYSGTTAKKVNVFLKKYLDDDPDLKLGIVISDFVTESLCAQIYGRNFK